MQAISTPVRGGQPQPHPRLAEVVRKHLSTTFRRVPSDAGRRAFDSVVARLAAAPFVLDAGCGTGASTLALARLHPDRLVLGVDKSAARLASGARSIAAAGDAAPDNRILLRCDLVDFWQLASTARLRCTQQYLLYPNPWPKKEHLKRRWHAHPVLPSMLALGGTIELRTNWPVYVEEFALALELAGAHVETCCRFTPDSPATPFERKYAASAHALWRCRAVVRDGAAPDRSAGKPA